MAGFNLFGFNLNTKADKKAKNIKSFVPPSNLDGAFTIDSSGQGIYGDFSYGSAYDVGQTVINEFQLITKYREMALHPDVIAAIDDTTDEAIITTENSKIVEIVLDEIDKSVVSEKIKEDIIKEFDTIKRLLNFKTRGWDLFRSWYIDGRLYHHIILDKNSKAGILELRYIDPRQIQLIRKIQRENDRDSHAVDLVGEIEEFYVFSPNGIQNSIVSTVAADFAITGTRIEKDTISYIHSGILDKNNRVILSHLDKASKFLNQVSLLEDALVIYRLARAPERRIFYVDVGNMPKPKAMQYVKEMSDRFKNKLIYDPGTGLVANQKNRQSMLEDYWLPRREGNRGTEISTLPGGLNLGAIEDLEYFKARLYRALGVPISRMESGSGFSLGKSSEISRDEIKFNKFINRLQNRFSELFIGLLRIQLSIKGIMSVEDFDKIRQDIVFSYETDSFFSELKNTEILRERIQTITDIDSVNEAKFFSKAYIRREVLKMTDEEIEAMEKELLKEVETDKALGIVPEGQEAVEEPAPKDEKQTEEKPDEKEETDPDDSDDNLE